MLGKLQYKLLKPFAELMFIQTYFAVIAKLFCLVTKLPGFGVVIVGGG